MNMNEDSKQTFNVPAVQAYTPVELTGIFRTYFDRKKPNSVVWVRGIYIQRNNNNPQWAFAYDDLRDVSTSASITLKISHNDRTRLKSNSLVQVGGLIEFNPYNNGNIQMLLNVTRVEVVKDQFVTEQDLKRDEIRQRKNKKGYKNVDATLENILFKDARPKVLLVFAGSSITQSDFRSGLEAAASKIDFTEESQSFGNAAVLSAYLKSADKKGYDAMAIVRGGGGGIEALDAVEVLDTIADMDTPVISAIGHVEERLFFKTLADKEVAVPHALGTYFKDMVERVAEKRNSSRAVLVQEVQKQFQKQIEDSNKKNKELLEQVGKLQKASQEQAKSFNDNLAKVQKQNKETVEQLQKQNKENIDKLTKQNADNLTKVQHENQKTIEGINKAHKEALDKIEKSNSELQKSLAKVNEQNTLSAKALAEAKGNAALLQRQLNDARKGVSSTIVVALVVLTALIAFFIGRIL